MNGQSSKTSADPVAVTWAPSTISPYVPSDARAARMVKPLQPPAASARG